MVAALPFHSAHGAPENTKPSATKPSSSGKVKSVERSTALETYKNLIEKAQNLTLQRDRLQASQVLINGIKRETKNSAAYKELVRALDELSQVFYTEKAQGLVATAESILETRPKDAIDQLQEALRVEDGNLTILKSLARAYLRKEECDRGEQVVQSAEAIHPYSSEVKLLRLQTLSCQQKFEALATRLANVEADGSALEKFARGLQVQEHLRKKDFKKARSLLSTWENQAADYPEVHFWKWEISKASGGIDREAALKYSQLCQNLSPRKRQAYLLDVALCRKKEIVDEFLKQSGLRDSAPIGDANDDDED